MRLGGSCSYVYVQDIVLVVTYILKAFKHSYTGLLSATMVSEEFRGHLIQINGRVNIVYVFSALWGVSSQDLKFLGHI
jgi:diacylglycerol kinase